MGEDMRLVLETIIHYKEDIIKGKDIQKILDDNGNHYDIKTIYNMIKQINLFFKPILNDDLIKSIHRKGFTIANDLYEDGQLQFLIDAINYNRDLSYKEKKQLIDKLMYFSSNKQKERVINHLEIDEKPFSLMLNLSVIMNCIYNQKNIIFEYVSYKVENNKAIEVASKHGNKDKSYIVSPYSIILDNNHYYLVGYFDKRKDSLSMYRVDRMRLCRSYKGKYIDIREQYDMEEYVKNTFNMFVNGEEIQLVFSFHQNILREVVSRFSEKMHIRQLGNHWYEAKVEVNYTKGLMNWILMLSSQIKIISPYFIKEEIKEEISKTLALYEK